MQKYYKITGLDEGVPITPFAVCCNLDSDELDYYLDESGDRSRYYEEISKSEYERLIKEQIRIAHANYHQDAFEYYFWLYRIKGGSFTKEQILKQKA